MIRRAIAALALSAVLVLSGVAGVAGTATAQMGTASVSFQEQTSGGTTMTVDSVTVPDGGFVTVHDSTLTEGNALGSVVGTSSYLEPGTHEDVEVRLEEDVETGTFVAMPHRDTDGDRTYDFVSSGGADDGPYVFDGAPVTDAGKVTVTANVVFETQSTDGDTVTVASATLHNGGFVTIHDASLQDGATFESVRGTSEYLPPGTHENVEVELDEPVEESGTLVAMAHRDTDGDRTYTFVQSQGRDDGPYVATGAVVSAAQVEFAGGTPTATPTPTETSTPTPTETSTPTPSPTPTEGGGPGFGVVVALIALLAGALVLTRRE